MRFSPSSAAALLAVLLASPATAARFGVPDASGDPAGYFVLTGPQIPTGIGNQSYGDERHGLDLFIEVTGSSVTVEIYDPGLVGSAGTGLDAFFNGDIGLVTYRLLDPTDTILAERSFGSDDLTTDRLLVPLYSGPTIPGLHRLETRMEDGPLDDEDINAFGVSSPGYDMYSWHFTGGEVGLAGATITDPLIVYPWLVHGTPDVLAGEQITGVDVSTWDLDSATAPPTVRLQTPSGRGAGIQPSPDSGLFVTNLRGLDVGPLDCSDYGIYQLSVDGLDQANEGPNDLNIFTAQLYDYDAGVTPAEYPIAAGDPRRPVRIYYPRDDGSAPLKESLVQMGRVSFGRDPPVPGLPSQVEVRLEIRNPTGHELTDISLVTHAADDPQLGLPVVTGSSPTLSAALLGRELQVTGSVPAGETGFVTYEMTLTGSGLGFVGLTGDGTDLHGGLLPTESLHSTPFETDVRLGPICMLRIEVMDRNCSATAVIEGELDICEGESVVLGSAGSVLVDCPGGVETRWLRDGVEIFGYPGPATITEAPAVDTLYQLEIRCDAMPTCVDSSAVIVRVEPDIAPPSVGDTLRVAKEFAGHRFTWATNGAVSYHLRQHLDPRFDIPTSTLVADVPAGEHFLPATPPRPPRVDFYLVFGASCAGTEGP